MKLIFTLHLLFFCLVQSLAQSKTTPILERKISITINREKLPAALNKIGRQGKFSFSYNAALIQADQEITLEVNGKSVREILKEIFKGSLHYKEKGNHLILTKAPVAKSIAHTTVFVISGYVEDNESGARVANASVFEKGSLTSSITNEFGYYRIILENKGEPVWLSVSRKSYKDTVAMVTVQGDQYVNIALQPLGSDTLAVTAAARSDSTEREEKHSYEAEANIQNIHDTLYRDIQVSLLPFVSTNGRLSGNVINDYSINIFGGYSLGTRHIELGFFLNADRGDVSWLQIAGLGNAVGGNVYGIQAAGIFNVNRGETKAVQLATFANTNLGAAWGVQAAAFANTNLRSADGVLVAGFTNFVKGKSKGVEVAGCGNIQIHDYQGSQIAGLSNISTHSITGSQIASVFNYGRKVHGTQIGLFNYADSLGGVPVGLISFVNHGYHKIEISADEIFYSNIAFRTGVRRFYNILSAGMKPEKAFGNNGTVWTFGYGMGTAPRLTRWLDLNIDLTSNQVNKGGFTNELSLLNKVYVGFDVRFARKMSITFGATLNGYLTKNAFTDYPVLFTDYSPHIINDHNFSSNINLKMWWGLKAGLRFL